MTLLERAVGRVDRLPVWAGPASATAAAVAGGALVATENPTSSSILPPCPLYALTGIYCPGCGSTRATHALLNGDLVTAFDFNPLMVLAIPVLVYAFVRWWSIAFGRNVGTKAELKLPPQAIYGLFVVVVVFSITRNLPWSAFSWMAP
jgi:hypothetical protein